MTAIDNPKSKIQNRHACLVFLGCPKNQVDSEHVLGSLTEAGYSLTTDPHAADLIVITTCAFLQSAVRESEAAIREALKHKQESPGKRIVVAGCIVERYGKSLKHKFPAVDLWVPLSDMSRIPQLLANRRSPIAIRRPPFASRPGRSAICTRPPGLSFIPHPSSSPRVLSTPSHFAYLKIADGCDNRCSYCMIPDIRGPFHSRPMRDIVAEARDLARAGVKELILVAQDTTLYGTDLGGGSLLAQLLAELGKLDGIRWLRLMYTHPAHLTEDVIDEFASNPKLCRYIDLPIQHVADHLLAKMNRRYTREDVELLLESLRAIPDIHIRTTIIVGLPGETEAGFNELLAFVRAARFDRLSCYAYSPEPGTKATRLSGQVSPAVKKERVRRLMLAQAAISRANLKQLVGRKLTVLVDSPDAENGDCTAPSQTQALGGTVPDFPPAKNYHRRQVAVGRTEWDAPEIDGVVRLSGRKVRPGSFVQALVTSSSTHDLTARVL
ncbi:MAG TPA: 30S ribosomal protein S12 methylthiotransferase RimO [bacterium]|nr:30S ribosomal protein S12 methylthiotransferase RimO [bacterium]